MNRRRFLRLGAAVAASSFAGSGLWQEALAGALASTGPSPYGPLEPPDANGLMLPAGFSSRIIATAGQLVEGTSYQWHVFPDGGATFRVPGGWVYVSNAEFIFGEGVGAIRFDHLGRIVDAYQICSGTLVNCAGGTTPWDTWLTCEETSTGLVHECDPLGVDAQQARPAMGRFQHEAVACDPVGRQFYLTEDEGDGGFYRFTPDVWGDLSSGLLEIAEHTPTNDVVWHEVPIPDPVFGPNGDAGTRSQVPESTPFKGGEGIVNSGGNLFFTTKGDGRVWSYDPVAQTLCVIYDGALDPGGTLNGVDNITADRRGNLIVAEDHRGGDQELVLITPGRSVAPLMRMVGQDDSELVGPAFDPWERRLYVSSQRGNQFGLTYEITGPFRRRFHC